MAAKMKCPACGRVLRQLGDVGKSAEGEYLVYANLAAPLLEAGERRLLQCLSCGESGEPWQFDPDMVAMFAAEPRAARGA